MRRLAVEILWLIVLIVFSAIMGMLLFSGDILLCIALRMVPVAWFGFAVFCVLSVYQLLRVGKCLNGSRHDMTVRLNGLVFLIPVVLFLTVAPNESTSQTLPNQSVELVYSVTDETEGASVTEEDISPTSVSDETFAEQETPTQTSTPEPTEAPATQTEEETDTEEESVSVEAIDAADALPCILTDETSAYDTSADSFEDYLYTAPEDLAGETVTMYGYVYKDESLPEDTIIIARLYITCCMADASVVGYCLKVEDTDVYEEGEWICATGVMAVIFIEMSGTYYDYPLMTDGTITWSAVPSAEYAYIYP